MPFCIGDWTPFLCIQGTAWPCWNWGNLLTWPIEWVWEVCNYFPFWFFLFFVSLKSNILLYEQVWRDCVLILCLLFINRAGLEKAKKELAGSIQKGVSFVRKWVTNHMVTNDNGCAFVVCLKYLKLTFPGIRGRVFVFP